MHAKFIRIFRTTSSERFLLHDPADQELGLFDLHFLPDGKVAGNLFLLESKIKDDDEVRGLLDQIDTQLVPAASFEDARLSFTVTKGELIGTFSNEEEEITDL